MLVCMLGVGLFAGLVLYQINAKPGAVGVISLVSIISKGIWCLSHDAGVLFFLFLLIPTWAMWKMYTDGKKPIFTCGRRK